MLGGGGAGGGCGEDVVTVTVLRDEHGYGMKVSGDKPVYVQSVKEHGAAWRAGLRAGDRILKVDSVPVTHHTHSQVVHMIRANPSTVLTVQQNARHKTPITAPQPVTSEKQRQLDMAKLSTMRMMLEQEQKYIRDLRNELAKVPDVRKQAQLESAETRCATLQHQIDSLKSSQPTSGRLQPQQPATGHQPTTGFLSGLPRSLSNLTGQSLRNLRQARNKDPPQLIRQNSDESNRRLNNTATLIPTTCLDNVTPPPLPPRSIERPPKRQPLSPPPILPLNPLPQKTTASPIHSQYYKPRYPDKFPMHKSMPGYEQQKMLRSSHSLDGELDGPQPNSIALQMSYPLVNVPPPPLQTDDRGSVPVLHVRSQSSPEHLDHDLSSRCGATTVLSQSHSHCGSPPARQSPRHSLPPGEPPRGAGDGGGDRGGGGGGGGGDGDGGDGDGDGDDTDTPPPGTPPPPYHHNTQPCADPQRAIISMEEDDTPSDNPAYSGLFGNLRQVRQSRAKTAVLLNWLLGEKRCACACLLLVITDGFANATGAAAATLRRWAYEIQSTFLMPNAVLQLNGVDENMANEIEHVLVNEHEKEDVVRNVFRKARQRAKEELAHQLAEFQVKRQVGLGALYGPDDSLIHRCEVDKAQEQVVVERIMCERLRVVSTSTEQGGCPAQHTQHTQHTQPTQLVAAEAKQVLLAAIVAAALVLSCRPAAVCSAAGGSRASFLQRDKHYKQRLKQLNKQHTHTLIVRGHQLQLQALTSVGHCHHCDLVIWGLAPQAYVCTACNLRVHRGCARSVEEGCCLGGSQPPADPAAAHRISRLIDRINPHHNHNNSGLHNNNNQDVNDKKSRKTSGTSHFLNMERSFRKTEEEQPCEQTLSPPLQERRDESDESLYESADCHSDAISASDDALPRLGKTPTMSKESLKLAVTDEEGDVARPKKSHRKTMSLSNPLEMVKTLGDEWFDVSKKDLEKMKSKESLWSEEERDSLHESTVKLDAVRKNSKKENNSQSNSRKSSTTDQPTSKPRKTSKTSSVSALNFLRRKKTPTSTLKAVEAVVEVVDKIISTDELLNYTKLFLEAEKRHASIRDSPTIETDSEEEIPPPTPKPSEHRRRLSRQTSRSKIRGKSQSVKVNTLRKSHSGTLKKTKKKGSKIGTPSSVRSRQTSVVETPVMKKKSSESMKHNSWFSGSNKGEPRREGSTEEPAGGGAEGDDHGDALTHSHSTPDKEHNWRSPGGGGGGGGRVNRAESCRERDAPRRGKHRNASDPNRLTKHNHHDLEPGAATAPSGSSSSSSLSSRSNESNTATVGADQQASQSDWSEEDEPLAAQWADSLPAKVLDGLLLSPRLRKRQEVIHELIVSEGSHVRWLKVLGTVFLRPLERQSSLLPAEELRALFPNLPAVRERHSRLYAALRQIRHSAPDHIVAIAPVADAILNTLGDSGYAPCLARFCRGQRMALEALRERRRKSKELHQLLASREQLPLCARLQLRDLLACVWQRLTKYQLLLESILKTVETEGEGEIEESEEDVKKLRKALDTAKDVLQIVDHSIRTAENEHRLRCIQNKLEIRMGSGSEWEEARRLDLSAHSLRLEGELTVRADTKKTTLQALMLESMLVLLQREGDRYVLKPIPQPGQQGALSPLIRWDKVLFRPNAAVKNTFFLMNINGVQMHELSANTNSEYATWVKHIQELPLAKPELKPSLTPSHQASRSTDDSGINVSRNPSDASEKSSSLCDDTECERDRAPSAGRVSSERERDDKSVAEERRSVEKEEAAEREDKHVARRPTQGRISTHVCDVGGVPPPPPLCAPTAVAVTDPPAHTDVHTASVAYSYQEQLRRLDAEICSALRAKSALVCRAVGLPAAQYAHVAELAVADVMGLVDSDNPTDDSKSRRGADEDLHQLLLAAHHQVNQLTELVSSSLTVSESDVIAASVRRRGHCDRCTHDVTNADEPGKKNEEQSAAKSEDLESSESAARQSECPPLPTSLPPDLSTLRQLSVYAAGLQVAVGKLVSALPGLEEERRRLRGELVVSREREHRLRERLRDLHSHSHSHSHSQSTHHTHGYPTMEDLSFPKEDMDQTVEDRPSNGG